MHIESAGTGLSPDWRASRKAACGDPVQHPGFDTDAREAHPPGVQARESEAIAGDVRGPAGRSFLELGA